ncbi:MAG: hypothetical protein A3K19_21610 [Lentisphaerae bacterium RIFOXYB12_FULL_65_16]|nr:MAG: hypothetical protein A3K18_20860 [Lentisphaerae bacterium RIFOXYA12_64_32]OGV93865.1 MAG: hypothetical protein A3K19_21610 [Lentisphaerae bacterium RIFOXYB12_FULL_65_16]
MAAGKKRSSVGKTGRVIYAASESCADLLFATGLLAPDAFFWFEIPGQAGVVLSPLEVGRGQKQVKSDLRVMSLDQARSEWRVPDGKTTPEALISGLARHTGIDVWEVPVDFPLALARSLQRAGVRLRPVRDFFPARARKTAQEVEHIREGVRLAEAGLSRAIEVVGQAKVTADGKLCWREDLLTAEILRGEIAAEVARLGGMAARTIAASGPQGADPHQVGSGPIRAGDPIVLDIFPRVDTTGYFGDLTRTVVKGTPSEIALRAYRAVREAQQRAIDTVKAGVKVAAVHGAAKAALDAAGFQTDTTASPPHGFIHGTGHGLGLEIHEAPRVGDRTEAVLEEGHVITIEPGLYYSDWGGVRLEDVVVVRHGGCDNLTSAGFQFQVD